MIKLVALIKSNLSSGQPLSVSSLIDELRDQWLPGGQPDVSLRGLVVSDVYKPFDESSDVLAMVELWTDELMDGQEGVGHLLPRGATLDLRADLWLTREHVFKTPVEREGGDSSPEIVKLAGTAFRRDDFTREAFFEYWRTKHAPISGNVPGVGGYVVSEALERLAGDSSADAVLELWYADEKTFEMVDNAPEQAAAWEDVPRYAKPIGVFWLMHERVILPPPGTGPGVLDLAEAKNA